MAADFATFIEPMLTGQDRAPRGPLDGPRGDRMIDSTNSSAARHSARDPVASGLLDLDWIGAQLGTEPATPEDAARAVISTPDISPHPLFEATWLPEAVPGRPATCRRRSGTSPRDPAATGWHRTR